MKACKHNDHINTDEIQLFMLFIWW